MRGAVIASDVFAFSSMGNDRSVYAVVGIYVHAHITYSRVSRLGSERWRYQGSDTGDKEGKPDDNGLCFLDKWCGMSMRRMAGFVVCEDD